MTIYPENPKTRRYQFCYWFFSKPVYTILHVHIIIFFWGIILKLRFVFVQWMLPDNMDICCIWVHDMRVHMESVVPFMCDISLNIYSDING